MCRHFSSTSTLTTPVEQEQAHSMKNWSKIFKRGDLVSADGTSSSAANSMNEAPREQDGPLKDRLKTFLPQSWSSILQKWRRANSDGELDYTGVKIVPNGTRVSPPVSPIRDRRHLDPQDSLRTSSDGSQKPLLRDSPVDDDQLHYIPEESELTSIHPAEYYAEKLEVYNLKYSYMKSWPGLLRLLAGLELLFGGMVLACVCAYIHKDSEWSNAFGVFPGVNNMPGYSYKGPMTLFVLAVVGVAWIITVILLVMGLTMYYRTILLDSPWWPLTEGIINVALTLLYMASGIVYLNDLNRGGLCYMTVGANPMMSSLCRVAGGQMAGTAFIFINMLIYLISFLVCLKMWRHEAIRRERELYVNQEQLRPIPMAQRKPLNTQTKRIAFEDEMDISGRAAQPMQPICIPQFQQDVPGARSKAIPSGYAQRPRVIADYVMKYPEIHSLEEREKYKAVFNDQYQEYKDLHREVSSTLMKFRELDAVMCKLIKDGKNQPVHKQIQQVLNKYEQKKNDNGFLEKKERCDYLKAKLSHIKDRIRDFDLETVAKCRT
ncbi:hypothetical protein UPYG_G00298090 [Umbra pygmaea]|uniref:MARVEL domain-containing protein 2-like n=1 Tax=Umbra pygmaea TaxID=75934 RepID=A0ABD0WSM3_UMBPY